MKLITEQDRGRVSSSESNNKIKWCGRCLQKAVKQNEVSMADKSYLAHSRRKCRMHPWKDIRYSDPSSLHVLYLLIENTEEKLFSYQITDKMWLQ